MSLNPFHQSPEKFQKAIAKGLSRSFDDRATKQEDLDLASARVVILSDQHKGTRDGADDFLRGHRVYAAALGSYLENGWRLVVLGDVEELWENPPEPVLELYGDVLELEAEFHRRGRYERFWGNHDDLWRYPAQFRKHLGGVFPDLMVREALRWRVTSQGDECGLIFLVHGHQGTLESERFAWISRRFVRHVWRPIQRRLNVPWNTPALDWKLRGRHERAMFQWSRDHPAKPVTIAGHTHRPVFANNRVQPRVRRTAAVIQGELDQLWESGSATPKQLGDLRAELEFTRAEERRFADNNDDRLDPEPPCYFNTGCCSFGDGDITGLEISGGEIRLVRWAVSEDDSAGAPAGTTAQRHELDHARLTDVFQAVRSYAASG